MNNSRLAIALLLTLVIGIGLYVLSPGGLRETGPDSSVTTSEITITKEPFTNQTMKLTSPAFTHNSTIPTKYTCDGEDISPPLLISETPAEAKSLVLIVDDPDAPVGDWVHWTLWNIPPSTTEIEEARAPAGIEGTTDFGRTGWGGPCPPSGTHRYFFKLFALDTELTLPESAGKAEILDAINNHILDSTELIGTYARAGE